MEQDRDSCQPAVNVPSLRRLLVEGDEQRVVNAPRAQLRWGLVAALFVACTPSAEKHQRHVATCATARAAYGSDIAACLIVRCNGRPDDAQARAAPIVQREREVAESAARAEQVRLSVRLDSITTALARAQERAREARVLTVARWATCIFHQDSVTPGGIQLVRPCEPCMTTSPRRAGRATSYWKPPTQPQSPT